MAGAAVAVGVEAVVVEAAEVAAVVVVVAGDVEEADDRRGLSPGACCVD